MQKYHEVERVKWNIKIEENGQISYSSWRLKMAQSRQVEYIFINMCFILQKKGLFIRSNVDNAT